MQGSIRAGTVAAPRDCRAQPAWLRGHSVPDKSRDTPADICEARINRRAGSVTHNATAGANHTSQSPFFVLRGYPANATTPICGHHRGPRLVDQFQIKFYNKAG